MAEPSKARRLLGDKAKNLAWSAFGRYALLDKIGSGGMAEIYRAKTFGAAGFEKEFAIKLILPSLVDDSEFVDMFINEAKIAVSLYHANIVQVFDLGEIDGQYYIAMEFVNGMDLLDVLARCANLELKIPLDLVLFITMEMLKGLDFAHRAKDAYGDDLNIIHRDVSPSNVLMSYAGDVKIGDFGVAKAAIQRNLTETGTLKGKVGYMSPEQVVGDQIDWRSDIFSAGIVFFEALSMSRLFVGNSDLDVMLRVRDAAIDESIAKAGPFPSSLEAIIRRALSKHREERFQTAGEFFQALVDFSYQHRIKVNGSHLSNFMRRLFAEEIEQERSRRLSDLDGKHAEAAAQAASHGRRENSDPQAPAERRSSPRDSPRATPPPKAEPASAKKRGIRISVDERRGDDSDAQIDTYRYRDASGLIYGPVALHTLMTLLADRQREAGERVSVEQGPWQKLSEVDELAQLAELRAPVDTEPADTHQMDRIKAIHAAANALEEISLSNDGNATESNLADHSSPVLNPPPEVHDTADEPRTPEIEKLRDQYGAYTGTFDNVTLARLLARLHSSKATGRLWVKLGAVEKSVYFENGEPILVDSNKEDELLGYFLISRRVITQAQLEEGLARLSEWGGRLGDALVAIGAIPAHEIFKHLSEQMREKILEVFTWAGGEWGYFENQAPETHGYPLGIDAWGTIVEGCLERMPISAIRDYYRPNLKVPLHREKQGAVPVEELRLTAKALRVLKAYKDGDTIEALVGRVAADENYSYRCVYLLHQVEVFSFGEARPLNLPGSGQSGGRGRR